MNRKLFIGASAALGLLVALAVGLSAISPAGAAPLAQGSIDFQDVPPTNPFFGNIRNIYFAGIVNGYPCGAPGEPCGPEFKPYYRPGAYVTRAQMSKFVDLARKQPGIFINTDTSGLPIFSRTGAPNGRGIQGESAQGNGLHGVSNSNNASGVYGENTGTGFGLAGRTGGDGDAIFGDNLDPAGRAGYFNGNVRVQGFLSKASGSFEIDHPLDPENKYLYHSFVESPDMMNVYNGNVMLDGRGEAVVQLPGYFEALNRDFRYQLTPLGAAAPGLYVAEEVKGNSFKIAGGPAGGKVSWQVTGIRHDPYAEQNRIQVEVEKPAEDKGSYLHPEVYGKPQTERIGPSR
ncbi:MAG TPA: S-layer homology domain-containing protein [Chloroflexia bacterium]|nr:S-layer homology domain-containing protein [Chloroflexia bacterium]